MRIGFIGCGFITQLHSRALRGIIKAGLVDAAVVATCDVDRARAEAFAAAHGADLVTTDADELLAAVDAVWICTPTSSHRALVEKAAGAGVAIFCEKPLATTLADAEAMASAATAVPSQVGLVLRTSPAYRALAALVHSGDIGSPMAVVLFDTEAGTVRYASAGHPPAFMWHGGDVRGLEATGPLISLTEDADYASREVPLERGDLVLLYTDGLAEARNGEQLFGEERISAHLRRDPSCDVHVLCKQLGEAAEDFANNPLSDDIAILAIRRTS
jgi:hypothetical protein